MGKPFTIGTILVTRTTETAPQFGKVKNIFYCGNKDVYIHAKQFETSYFNHYYHAYEVYSNIDKKNMLINVDLLPRLPLYLLLEKNGEELISCRYDL